MSFRPLAAARGSVRGGARRYGMDLGISGRRAAVAAASSGLGLAVARALAAEGVHVAICGRDRARVEAAAGEVGHDCVGLALDVGDAAGGAAFVAAATEALGG